MRIEQMVLFGPGEDFRVRFGGRLTVLAGLQPDERGDLINLLVDALAGRLPNASVVYLDPASRRVFADRTGATFAETGLAAPSLASLVGTDAKVVSGLVTLRAGDLGLGAGTQRSADDISGELAAERALAAQLRAEREESQALVVRLDDWRAELVELDERIDRAADDADRWAWMELRRDLAALSLELTALDHLDDGTADEALLGTVDQLRTVGATWAEASTEAAELSERLGVLPEVSDRDLARVAATPETLPEDFGARLAGWQRAVDVRRTREAEVVEADEAPTADDAVVHLARLDQDRLWAAAEALAEAKMNYEAELAALASDTDPEVEAEIEEAHREVLRCERHRQRRFLPGVLGSGSLAAGALLAGDQVSVLIGMAMLAGAVAMGWWLLVVPRRIVALAEREEEMALGRVDAGSWLGLHLRRIDDVMSRNERKGLDAAVDAHASAQLDWEEVAGTIELADAVGQRQEVAAYIEATDPAARSRRQRRAVLEVQAARADEDEARSRLTAGLDGYGLSATSAGDLDPAQLGSIIERRIAGGALARQALRLHGLERQAAGAGAELDDLLARLGFTEGELHGRLDAALGAVAAAKGRLAASTVRRSRAEVITDIAVLTPQVQAGRLSSWDASPDPVEAPTDPDRLVTRRLEVAELVRASEGPELVDAERRLAVAEDHIAALEAELDALAAGPAPLHRRISDRVARATSIGGYEEPLPVFVDDAFASLAPPEREAALDVLARLSAKVQVVVLTDDPVVSAWARGQVAGGAVTLFETEVHTAVVPV